MKGQPWLAMKSMAQREDCHCRLNAIELFCAGDRFCFLDSSYIVPADFLSSGCLCCQLNGLLQDTNHL